MSSLISFLFSKAFLKNVFIAIILAFIIIWAALWATGVYTHHDERIAVPNLKGKNLTEVKQIINEKNLRYEVQDSVFNRKIAPGSVIEQFPRSGQEVKRKRLIKLTIAAIAPQKITIEQVSDLSLRQAIGQLSKNGITVKNLSYISSSYTNLVLGISFDGKRLNKGDQIYKGEEVTLIVGRSEGVSFTVPDLTGLSAKYAKRKAHEAGFNIGKMTFKNTSEEGRKQAHVQRQSIDAGTTATPGSAINIILSEAESNIEGN